MPTSKHSTTNGSAPSIAPMVQLMGQAPTVSHLFQFTNMYKDKIITNLHKQLRVAKFILNINIYERFLHI
jgi:hypothetical protein